MLRWDGLRGHIPSLEEKILYLLARQHFIPQHTAQVAALCQNQDLDWPLLLQTAEEHLVAPLIYTNLLQCLEPSNVAPELPSPAGAVAIDDDSAIVPAGILHAFKLITMEHVMSEKLHRQKIAEFLGYLNEQGLAVMLVKSAALADSVYKEPWYTTPKDTDLLLRTPRHAITADQRAVIAGYRTYGIECDAGAHHDLTMNGVLALDHARIWRDAARISYHGQAAYVMAPEDLLISLCINSARKRFGLLKLLCDLAETVHAYPALDWAQFLEKVDAYGVGPIVYAALWHAQQTVGLKLPDNLLDDLHIHPLQAMMVRFLCRRLSLFSGSELRAQRGVMLFNRQLSASALLRYVTLSGMQMLRHMRFVLRTRGAEYEFWDGQ